MKFKMRCQHESGLLIFTTFYCLLDKLPPTTMVSFVCETLVWEGGGGSKDPQLGQKGHWDYPNNIFAKYRSTTLGRSKFKVG